MLLLNCVGVDCSSIQQLWNFLDGLKLRMLGEKVLLDFEHMSHDTKSKTTKFIERVPNCSFFVLFQYESIESKVKRMPKDHNVDQSTHRNEIRATNRTTIRQSQANDGPISATVQLVLIALKVTASRQTSR